MFFVQVRTVSKYQLELLREAVHDVSVHAAKLFSTRFFSQKIAGAMPFSQVGKKRRHLEPTHTRLKIQGAI